MTNYSRSVLKSNGLRLSKNLPAKFGFSSKTVPATIAKKLPPQRCFKPLLIPIFNFSYKRPTFVYIPESGYTLGFRRRIAHNGPHGETGGVSDGGGITTLGAFHTVRKPCVAGCQNGVLCRFGILAGRCSRRTQKAFGTAMRLCVSLFRRRRSPAGLFSFVEIALVRPTLRAFYTCKVWGCYHCSRYALRIVKVFRAQVSKRLTFVPTLRSW